MKLFLFFSSLLLSICSDAQEIKVMSYNIRYDSPTDAENSWEIRKDKLAALMRYYEPDFIGTQEVLHHQLLFLLQQLETYRSSGVGRTDGKEKGEYSAILYNKEKYDLLIQNTFWLSPTPDIPASKGWDAALERICTYGLFRNKNTKKYIWVFNSHFDHIGKEARLQSAKIIIEKIKQVKTKNKAPVIFLGDLNALPDDPPIQYLTTNLNDARLLSEIPAYGPENTWNAFQFQLEPKGRIDYIFIEKNSRLKVKKFITIDDFYNFKYPSDHLPVMAHIEIK